MASGTAIANAANATSGSDYDSVTGESVRIWAGALTNGNLQTAPFRVTDNGHLYATNATISGNITANTINASVIGGQNTSVNIALGTGTSVANPSPNTLYFLWGNN
jgi:hypothetical protein